MKRYMAFFVMFFVASFIFAMDSVEDELKGILQEQADTVISDLTFGEVDELLKRLSVPMQEAAYVKASKTASLLMPGKGQFMNEDILSGLLFMTADIAVAAGTLVGSYFLLPAELRFENLDYFNTPFVEIEAAWTSAGESATLKDSLAYMGVWTGGMILHHIIAGFSAGHAGKLAQQRIDEGIVRFEPVTSFSGHPHFGFGGRMRF
ncbi:MAG: hypothetical protein JW852_09130 [Spirochaetales bacterium]|nr:hypothetical protein [Spirochaetales bacterium]